MNFPSFSCIRSACAAALLLCPAIAFTDSTFEDGPVGFDDGMELEKAPWVEGESEYPAWPGKLNKLIELNVSTAGLPYRVYVDPASLRVGDDRVVRYTVVMVSRSGVRNITYEGLHCGERTFRRMAYGVDGEWHAINNPAWQRISGIGINQYRKLLYEVYFCNTSNRYQNADELVRKLRSGIDPATTEY